MIFRSIFLVKVLGFLKTFFFQIVISYMEVNIQNYFLMYDNAISYKFNGILGWRFQ